MLDPAPLTLPMPPCLPSGAGGLRVFAALRRNGYGAFPERCFDEPAVSLRALGRTLILAAGPDAMASVLLHDSASYRRMSVGRRVLGPIVGDGLLVSEGALWRQRRRAMAPAFTPRTVPVLARHIALCAERAVSTVAVDHPIDLFALTRVLALDVAAVSMFSLDIADFDAELRHAVTSFMNGIGTPRPSDFLLPPGVPTLLSWRRRRFRARWTALIRRIVASRPVSHAGEARDLFDMLEQAFETDGKAGQQALIDETATMIVAGHETTASVLFWASLLLTHAPQWQSALAAETRGLDLSPAGAADALARLPVAHAIVRETLRLYPPAFMSGREAQSDTTLCGQNVPKDAMILLPFWMLHRNPALWDAPNRFDPHRFLDCPDPPRFHYLPFGAGPHVCIGAQLAMTEAVLVLARLVQAFSLRLAGPASVFPIGTLATRPSAMPNFVLSRRL